MSASDSLSELTRRAALWASSNEAILAVFVARTAHDSGRTADTLRLRIAGQLRRYAARHAVPVPALRAVLTDPALFGSVLAADQRLTGPGRVSRGTVKGTRHAFAALVAALPPQPGATRDDLRRNLATARRSTERTVGLRRLVAVGEDRRREVAVPAAAEIQSVIGALRATMPLGHPAADLVAFLYLTGVRIGAALALTAADLRQMPDGTVWAFVEEKARPDARPVYVRPEQGALALAWRQLTADVPLWAVKGRSVRADEVRTWITCGCERAGVPRFTPHNLRHAFARDLVPHLGIAGTQRAGGWLAAPVLEEYIDTARRESA